jgi:hypothetical protein
MLKPLLNDGEQDPAAMEMMRRITADQLQIARGERAAIISAIEQFLDFGDAGDYSPCELWDYFSISAPNVPTLAGFDAAEEDRVTRIFSTCTHARYGDGQPLPPDWPWHETGGVLGDAGDIRN